jgi:hypothetical protein
VLPAAFAGALDPDVSWTADVCEGCEDWDDFAALAWFSLGAELPRVSVWVC